jgi:exonuclease III
MSNYKFWNVLCWNIRGMNTEPKLLSLRQKIEDSGCQVFCIQETKKDHFDLSDIRKFAPKRFDSFAFAPSSGASGGILVV